MTWKEIKNAEAENEGINLTKLVVSEKGERGVANRPAVELRTMGANADHQYGPRGFFGISGTMLGIVSC